MATKKKKKSKSKARAKEFWTTTNTPSGKKTLKKRATRIVAPKHDSVSEHYHSGARRFFAARAAQGGDVGAHMAAANKRGFGGATASSNLKGAAFLNKMAAGIAAAEAAAKKALKKRKKKASKKSAPKASAPKKSRKKASAPKTSAPKKSRKASAPKKTGRTVTAADLISGARARVTRSRTGSLQVWTCIGKIRSGCGGGKKGGHVIG